MRIIAWLSGIGVLFSGYFVVQYLRGACSGGCSYLGSVPTCLIGFLFFLAILIAALLKKVQWVRGFAIAAIIFSLYFSVQELLVCWTCYPLGLPNCFYGLIMYGVILCLTWCKPAKKSQRKSTK